jgi:hypothetical protein
MESQVPEAIPMNSGRDISLSLLIGAMGIALGFVSSGLISNSAAESLANSGTNNRTPLNSRLKTEHFPSSEEQFTHLISALHQGETLSGRAELYRVISQLRADELPGLIDRAAKLPLKFRGELTTALFERWMEIDPAAAEQWIQQEGRSPQCCAAWARIAPQRALDFFFASGRTTSIWQAVNVGLDQFVGKDPHARLIYIAGCPLSAGRNDILQSEFGQWAAADPASALTWAATVQDEKLRALLEETALPELAKRDPKAAIARINNLIPGMKATLTGNTLVSHLTRDLAEKDPDLAREFAESLPADLQVFPLIAAGSAWAKSEPVAALEWAIAKGINPARGFRTESIYSDSILSQAMFSKPKETVDWLLSLSEGNDRDAWLQNAAFRSSARNDPELLKKLFDAMSPDRQHRMAPEMGSELVGKGEFPTMDVWVSSFPDESVRARAIGGAIVAVSAKTPARTDKILAELPAGSIRDQSLSALAINKSYFMPVAAASQALEISDSGTRYDTLDQMMIQWIKRDRQTAETWLNSQSDVPDEWKKDWLGTEPAR